MKKVAARIDRVARLPTKRDCITRKQSSLVMNLISPPLPVATSSPSPKQDPTILQPEDSVDTDHLSNPIHFFFDRSVPAWRGGALQQGKETPTQKEVKKSHRIPVN
jgi:hypothetical protein